MAMQIFFMVCFQHEKSLYIMFVEIGWKNCEVINICTDTRTDKGTDRQTAVDMKFFIYSVFVDHNIGPVSIFLYAPRFGKSQNVFTLKIQ